MAATGQGRASARINVAGRGETNIATGVPVLDHLLSALAVYASFDLALEVAPGAPEAEIASPAARWARRFPSRSEPTEPVAMGRPSFPRTRPSHMSRSRFPGGRSSSRTSISRRRASRAGRTISRRVSWTSSQGAGLTLHVRLIDGGDTQHVLEAIFKALGVALAQAGRPRRREGE